MFSNLSFGVVRVNDCINNGRGGIIFEGIDKGIWMAKKKRSLQATSPVTSVTVESSSTSASSSNHTSFYPNDNWHTFPFKSIPRSFCYGIIHEYITQGKNLLESYCDSDESDDLQPVCGNSKAIQRGRLYCISDRIKNMEDNSYNNIYYLKAKIQSSFKINTIYDVKIAVDENSNIVNASCQFPASESLNCSHIVSLLFKLEEYTLQYGFEPLTCTSKLKEWNQGRKTGNDPSSIITAQYKKMNPSKIVDKNYNKKKIIEFSGQSKLNYSTDANILTADFVQRLQQKEKKSMWTDLLNIKYDDYVLDCNQKLILKLKVQQFKNNLGSSTLGPFEIQVEQNSLQWLNARRYRITASDCKSFYTSKNLSNLINTKLWHEAKDINHLSQIAYGRENESTAIQDYLTSINRAQIKKSGLIINNKFPGLGCSPDGLIYENNELLYCIEVKCPYKLRHCSPLNLTESKDPGNMCYTVKNNQVTLKRNHAYYYQIQLTLAILELQYCEFIVWTLQNGFVVERIYRDDNFINALTMKLTQVHNILAMEFFEMRLPRKLPLLLNDS